MQLEKYRYLAQLLGARSENDALATDLMTRIVTDYVHWRRNYFPDDEFLLTPTMRRGFEEDSERLTETVDRALAMLRRSFPFHSPRYIAHQQSESTLPSLLGLVAGALYNTNIVTPESGAVTVEWEIEACGALARMIGYTPPPTPPQDTNDEAMRAYRIQLKREYSWTHLTSGGTVANMEALWLARIVKFFPLAVKEACVTLNVGLILKSLNKDIREALDYEVIGLRPNEAIYLLARFVERVWHDQRCSLDEARRKSMEAIGQSRFSPDKGLRAAPRDHDPVILVTGAAHYSIEKAADLLGLGSEAIWRVESDASFRMCIRDLEKKLEKAVKLKKAVVAVVAIAGTTEEGAVDPVDQILEVRERFEADHGQSFWLHVDGAWGGFMRALFTENTDGVPAALLRHRLYDLAQHLGFDEDLREDLLAHDKSEPFQLTRWVDAFFAAHRNEDAEQPLDRRARDLIDGWADAGKQTGDYSGFLRALRRAHIRFTRDGFTCEPELTRDDFQISRQDRTERAKAATADDLTLRREHRKGVYIRKVPISWPSDPVGLAFAALGEADSVTIDPHKMGYTPYPCGAIAFKNDRVRHLIRKEAPYITRGKDDSASKEADDGAHLVHEPLRKAHLDSGHHEDRLHISTDAPAPFTLEGSRPGSAAASLWLASQSLPFDIDHHGQMVRASLLAARSLFEWIKHWGAIQKQLRLNQPFKIIPLIANTPDTNLVVFGVKSRADNSLQGYNRLNEDIYKKFSIRSELGEYRHSYDQPFFLSTTKLGPKHYPMTCLNDYFRRAGIETDSEQYNTEGGALVFRASVQNPYIWPSLKLKQQDFISEFMTAFTDAARLAASRQTPD